MESESVMNQIKNIIPIRIKNIVPFFKIAIFVSSSAFAIILLTLGIIPKADKSKNIEKGIYANVYKYELGYILLKKIYKNDKDNILPRI